SGSSPFPLRRESAGSGGWLPLALPSRRCALGRGPGACRTGQTVRFLQPAGEGRFHFVPVPDLHDVGDLRLRRWDRPAYLRGVQFAAEEQADLEEGPLGTHERVAGLAGEHDRLMRGIDTLVAERCRGLAEP